LLEILVSPRVVELALLLVLLELGAYLILLRRGVLARGVGLAWTLAAGAALLLALRAAMIDAGPLAIGAWLSAALVAHVLDLRQRWRQAGSSR